MRKNQHFILRCYSCFAAGLAHLHLCQWSRRKNTWRHGQGKRDRNCSSRFHINWFRKMSLYLPETLEFKSCLCPCRPDMGQYEFQQAPEIRGPSWVKLTKDSIATSLWTIIYGSTYLTFLLHYTNTILGWYLLERGTGRSCECRSLYQLPSRPPNTYPHSNKCGVSNLCLGKQKSSD